MPKLSNALSPALGPQPRPGGHTPNMAPAPPTATGAKFMAGVRLAVVGVPKNDANNLNLVKHTVGFLVQHCGAEYLYV